MNAADRWETVDRIERELGFRLNANKGRKSGSWARAKSRMEGKVNPYALTQSDSDILHKRS